MSERLRAKRLIIVGGTSGLGRSAALACLAAGARVVTIGRHPPADPAALDLPGDIAELVLGDATEPATIERAIEVACQRWGGVDGLYHVAGGSGRRLGDGPLADIPDEGWDFTLRQNLDSVFFSNRAVLRQFLQQGTGGAILNMASVLAYSPAPRHFATHAYAAAKAAILGLTTAAAAYYAPHNIRVNALAPALVETPMAARATADPVILEFIRHKQPLDGGRVGVPADVDDAVVYLLSEESRFVTGQVLAIDGGWSISDSAH